MRRPPALPVMIQVAALAAFAIVLSHAVAFGVLALSPEPRPAGFSIESAARALKGDAAETADGQALRRRVSDHPVVPQERDAANPLALAIRSGLAKSLGVPIDRVVVAINQPDRRRVPGSIRVRASSVEKSRDATRFVFVRRGDGAVVPSPPPAPAPPEPPGVMRLQSEIHARHGGPIVIDSNTPVSYTHLTLPTICSV